MMAIIFSNLIWHVFWDNKLKIQILVKYIQTVCQNHVKRKKTRYQIILLCILIEQMNA